MGEDDTISWEAIAAIGTWLAAIATFCAVLVSLHLSRRREHINLIVQVGHTASELEGVSDPQLHIRFVNSGTHPCYVSGMYWSLRASPFSWPPRKRYAWIQTPPIHAQLPMRIDPGQAVDWITPLVSPELDIPKSWAGELTKCGMESRADRLKAHAYTTLGVAGTAKPDANVIEAIQKAITEVQQREKDN